MPPNTQLTETRDDLSLSDLSTVTQAPTITSQTAVQVAPQALTFTPRETALLTNLIKSRSLPVHITTIEQLFTIGKMGRELGFPIMQAIHWIIPIQGKLTLSAKAIGALMRKNGVTMQTVEEACYIYRDGASLDYPRAVVDPVADKPIDRRTTIIFTRDVVQERVSFSWVDATNQELITKSNWKRMP